MPGEDRRRRPGAGATRRSPAPGGRSVEVKYSVMRLDDDGEPDADEHGPEDLQVVDVELRDEEGATRVRAAEARKPRLIGAIADLSRLLAADDEDPDGGGEDADAGDDERVDQARSRVEADRLEGRVAEDERGDDRDLVRLEEVGRHPGAVADVVADVVGDRGGVARVVLGDARLDLADEVGADVGGLGEDAAADTHEQRDERGAETEADEHGRRGVLEDEHDRRGADEAEADAEHAR